MVIYSMSDEVIAQLVGLADELDLLEVCRQ